jgi:hypothetical protein
MLQRARERVQTEVPQPSCRVGCHGFTSAMLGSLWSRTVWT